MTHNYQNPVDINLCAGAGGLALGLVEAGFAPSEFYDRDGAACETLRHNLRTDALGSCGRVCEGDLRQVEWVPSCARVRILAAGAPCQPFSMGGARRGPEDDRNLFPGILKAVDALRPQAILIENVRGLERGAHRPYLDYILRQIRFPDLPSKQDEPWNDHDRRLQQHDTDPYAQPVYRVDWGVFNSADFGVSQIRYRLFIVATDMGLPEYAFPTPTHSKQTLLYEQTAGIYWDKMGIKAPQESGSPVPALDHEHLRLPWVTVRDAISSLPNPSTGESQDCNNHWAIPGARVYSGHTGSALDWPSKTLKAGVHGVPGGENILVCEDGSVRYYTLREMARIQTFPANYYFTGARSNVTRQIGNAVPCVLATAVARPLRELFKNAAPDQGEVG